MCDKLVFDLAQEVEGAPAVFVRKDWINILDNMNQNYSGNQSVIDTSQLSNSNKYMSYRESYFLIPLTMTMASNPAVITPTLANGIPTVIAGTYSQPQRILPLTNAQTYSLDSAMGLKSWLGNLIHSFTVDYNGSTIVQQSAFVNMWNAFKLMTSLSYNDVITQGCTIGFYPDDAQAFEYVNPQTLGLLPVAANVQVFNYAYESSGTGVCNNSNVVVNRPSLTSRCSRFRAGMGNNGFIERQKWINYDGDGVAINFINNTITGGASNGLNYRNLLSGNSCNALWKSYVYNKKDQACTNNDLTLQTAPAVVQFAITACVYLKHVHSFFNMIPLLKGVFIKMTMNLNNTACTVNCGGNALVPVAVAQQPVNLSSIYQVCTSVNSAYGGVNPIMVASNNMNEYLYTDFGAPNNLSLNALGKTNGGQALFPFGQFTQAIVAGAAAPADIYIPWRFSLSVGGKCLDAQTLAIGGIQNQIQNSPLAQSIYLYIPAYSFNPTFEQAYLASPVKTIKYTDVYQYQINNVNGGGQQNFNSLLTNGISNVKSVLLLPFFSASPNDVVVGVAGSTLSTMGALISNNTGFISGNPVWQSPFDPAGTGTTSPLCLITDFNIQVSGQNAIYNLEKYSFEQFNNQLYGQNAVNGGLTDGITSSLVDRQSFENEYCYYYVNVERMLPVEQSVPKSIQALGRNMSAKAVDYICFVEYGVEVNIDVGTGSRM